MIDKCEKVGNIAKIAEGARCSKKAEIIIHPKGESPQKKIIKVGYKKVYEKSKRLFEIPPFKQYAICDGIYNLLFGRKFSREDKESIPQTPQLSLPLNISEFQNF